MTTELRKEVALMRSPDVPEDVRRILTRAADLMEQSAARLDRAQVAEAAIAARHAHSGAPRPLHVWSVVLVPFLIGVALTTAAAWFLIPLEEPAPMHAKAALAAVAPAPPKAPFEGAPGGSLALRLETELARLTPNR